MKNGIIVKEKALLLEFLFLNISKSKNTVKSLLKNGAIAVNGAVETQFNMELNEGDIVKFVSYIPLFGNRRMEIIYEDNDFLVVDKPSGVLSVASGDTKTNTVYYHISSYLKTKQKNAKIFVVHRLDLDTSGVMIFAKNERLKLQLQESWSELVSKRGYVAVVKGNVVKKSDRLKSWLKENDQYVVYSSKKANDGKLAITNYNKIGGNKKFSLLEINIETGRKNQIRVQLSDIYHTIIGDSKYGSKVNPLKRLALHANILVLKHPMSGKTFTFKSRIPEDFIRITR